MGQLGSPRSSTSHRNLPVRVGSGSPAARTSCNTGRELPLLDGFSNLLPYPNFTGRLEGGKGLRNNVSSWAQGTGKSSGRERKFLKQKCRQTCVGGGVGSIRAGDGGLEIASGCRHLARTVYCD